MKTNQEILDAYNLRPQGMPHSENVKFLMKALEAKDRQHREDMIEIWCDCGDLMEEDGRKDVWGDALYCLGCDKTVWQKLTQLK